MKLTIISGLSGSGKTVALHTLEDMGFYCVDNLPVALLDAFIHEFGKQHLKDISEVAVGIDARNHPDQISQFPGIIRNCRERGIHCKIIFLQAENHALLKRFSETRRKHPLTGPGTALADAIDRERQLLTPITASADLFIDTSQTNLYQLRNLVQESIGSGNSPKLSLVLKSFGYKHGLPADADFVFDVRCLPNPYWEPGLRDLTGLDKPVVDFLDGDTTAHKLGDHIEQFLETWVPSFSSDNRSYLNIAIGCTGGQHRSVYLVERVARQLGNRFGEVVIRHREIQ
jgi:UPF0042 nucleotide-binding protein